MVKVVLVEVQETEYFYFVVCFVNKYEAPNIV